MSEHTTTLRQHPPLPDIEVSYAPEPAPPVPVLPPKARRLTLSRLLVPVPPLCTCDPKRWRSIHSDRIRHEPSCPRRRSAPVAGR